jgi:dienelactone hydrolase
MDEVFGVRATEGDELPPPALSTVEGEMTIETANYAGDLPDYIYVPAEEPSLPTFVLIGGGPVPPSEVHHMSALATALAAQGAVVHVVGYRSEATGNGIGQTLEDIRCAVAYARSTVADFAGGEQVVLVGFSYGGDAVVSAATTDGPVSSDCAATTDGVADAVVALDGFPDRRGDTGHDVPMLFVGATSGEGPKGRQLATAMRDEGYEIESLEFQVDHGTVIDASPTIGVVAAIVDFVNRLDD